MNKEASTLPDYSERAGLPALISGLSAVHRANLAAAIRAKSRKPIFIICPDDTAAESFQRDMEAFLGEKSIFLGMREFTFYPVEAASRQAEQRRIWALHAIVSKQAEIIVASVTGLLQRTMSPELLRSAALEIQDGRSYQPEEIEKILLRCGYTRTDQVEGPGQYARRGGILDFFSPADRYPVRIEFWGDEIDSMGRFDVNSQRREESISCCTILPAAETLTGLYPGGNEALAAQLEKMAESYGRKRSSSNAQQIKAEILADCEKLQNGVSISDADRYMPLIYPESYGCDYIPEDAVVFFDQPSRCMQKARDYVKQLSAEINEMQYLCTHNIKNQKQKP